jgi:hypothetical protein
MSSSSADSAGVEPTLSIVVGSNGAAGSVERCLAALEPQAERGSRTEVIVCEPEASPAEVREHFAFARFHERRGALVPELWRDGIDLTTGELVALTISPMEPTPNWVETIRNRLGHVDAVGGAIEPGERLRLVDWAEYFCRYVNDMLPFPPCESVDLPGDNAAYRRDGLVQAGHSWADGFWEPDVHRALKAAGRTLVHDPALVVRQGRSAGFTAFVRQRLVHGRAYGRQRGVHFGVARNLAGVLLAFVVPGILLLRQAGAVLAKRRHRGALVASLPALLAFDVAWAVGEALGHLDTLRRR